MKLIFGGSYQGKLAFAKELSQAADAEIFTFQSQADCQTPEECMALSSPERSIPKDTKILNHFERFTYACASDGRDATAYVKEHPEMWQGRILVCDDISQGVVPMDKTERAWREMNGRVLAYLAQQAGEVYRVFCGIPQKIK